MKFKLLILIISVYYITALGQANSSYTRYGIGDIQYSYSGRRLGMGEVSTSIADIDFVNANNPATLFKLNLTRFELSLKFGGDRLSNGNQSKFYANSAFNGFTFGFPISSLYGIGAAFGILPVSNISYNSTEDFLTTTNSLDTYSLSYSGSGGLSKIFLGSSYRTPFNINIGATFEYYFGNLNYTSSVSFPNNSGFNAVYNKKYSPRGLGTNVGLLSPDISSIFGTADISEFRIGAAVNYISKLNTDTILVGSSSFRIDTLGGASVKMKIPVKISAGLSFILNSKFLLSLDYFYQPWSNFSLNGIKSEFLRNASKFSAGFEFRPLRENIEGFWDQFKLRAGLSYEQTQYIINGEGINKFSVSGGFSIPVSLENTIDVGLEYGIRGTDNNGLFKENSYRINVSANLGDLWFIRRER